MNVEIPKQRLLPASEREKRHRHRNRHVDADHADLDLVLEAPGRATGTREQRRAVAVRVAVHERNRLVERFGAQHHQHRPEDLVLVDRHLRRHVIEQSRAQEEPVLVTCNR